MCIIFVTVFFGMSATVLFQYILYFQVFALVTFGCIVSLGRGEHGLCKFNGVRSSKTGILCFLLSICQSRVFSVK